MKKLITLISIAAAPFMAQSAATFSTDFPSTSLPTGISVDGEGALASGIYKNVDENKWWFVGRTDANNCAALIATRGAESQRHGRLVLPAVEISSEDAAVIWDARSMHTHLFDSYRVLVSTDEGSNWETMSLIRQEGYEWTTHSLSLKGYVGKKARVAFESISLPTEGFMLAIDNISVGTPQGTRALFVPKTKRYVDDSAAATISGTLINYGGVTDWTELAVVSKTSGDVAVMSLSPLKNGEQINVEFSVAMAAGETLEYSVVARGGASGKATTLYKSDITCSYFERIAFLDRFSGTWCNNCTAMELVVSDYKQKYGDQIVVAESHVNDVLVEDEYWLSYGRPFVFSVPVLVANHNTATSNDLKRTGEFLTEMREETIAGISTSVSRIRNQYMKFTSKVQFAKNIDNSADRYRVGYLLLADIHENEGVSYMQQNASSTAAGGEYFYMPSIIKAEMMYYENVVIEGSTATTGVAGSLGRNIYAYTPITVNHTISIPEKWSNLDITAVALVIDNETGKVVNCAFESAPGPSTGIASADVEMIQDGRVYDLWGREVTEDNLQPGIYIRNGKKFIK